jgi:hypothetical protein
MRALYSKRAELKSRPKPQRAIIADILLEADKPISFGEIVSAAKKSDYENTLKQKGRTVTVEESVSWHLGEMVSLGTVKESLTKD